MSSNFTMIEPPDQVAILLDACPFLKGRVDTASGPYMAMGAVGRMITRRELSDVQIQQVFDAFSDLAERADCDIELLATGALEMLNDDRATAVLARKGLRGRALEILEEMRVGWGQPDYS
jgi:hypothetical protein